MSKQANGWRILYIDDDEEDYFIARTLLSQSKARKITIEWVSTFEDGCARLADYQNGQSDPYDAVLVDYDLGGKSGIEIVQAFSANYPAPLILYTGRGSHEIDQEAQQAGATMYLAKNEATSLLFERVIRYAIERKQSDHALRQSQQATQQKNEMLSLLNESATELLAGADPVSRLDDFLYRAGKVLGLEVYVQYNLSEDGTYLKLGKIAGFPDRYLKVLSRLELGQAVCGTVAKIRKPIYVNGVQGQKDKMTRLIRKLGIDTYACHPLMVGGRLYGTLSFGSRSRSRFEPEEIEILKTFCNMVAEAIARKQAEEALRENEEKFRSAFERAAIRAAEMETVMDTAPAMIWIARDPQCKEMTGNRYGYEFLNMWSGANISKTAPEGVVSQQPYRNFKDGREILPEELPMQIAAATGKPASNYDFDLVFNDGTVRTVLGNVNPLLDPHGQPCGAVAVFTDITDRRKAEEALQHYAEELERSNQALSEFTTIASHDLQEPLRKIRAFGEILETHFGPQLTHEGKDYLKRMTSAATRMSEMLQSLLAFSRVTSHSQPFAQVNLNQVAKEVVSDLEVRIKETGAHVRLSFLPTIESDPLQMHQLFLNLIGNAIKYRRPGVPPEVTVSSCEMTGKKSVFIRVQDNGVGFDMKDAERIFQPFVRLHGRTVYEGTGMGLAICHKIVQRHGGSIHAQSTPGAGSIFTVELPIQLHLFHDAL